MFRFSLLSAITLSFVSAVTLSFVSLAEARVVDGDQPANPVIKDIVEDLDARGIDVRNGLAAGPWAANDRPQVTVLQFFPVDASLAGKVDPSTVASERAYLVAVKSA